eukprot:m.640627 g.640627  ORF g.640627 m.640627 type:complete len:50 (-) comp58343_c0_seq20:125-274(-)
MVQTTFSVGLSLCLSAFRGDLLSQWVFLSYLSCRAILSFLLLWLLLVWG